MRRDIICQVSNWKSTFLLLSYKPVKTGYNGNAGIGCTPVIQQCITKSQVMARKPYVLKSAIESICPVITT